MVLLPAGDSVSTSMECLEQRRFVIKRSRFQKQSSPTYAFVHQLPLITKWPRTKNVWQQHAFLPYAQGLANPPYSMQSRFSQELGKLAAHHVAKSK